MTRKIFFKNRIRSDSEGFTIDRFYMKSPDTQEDNELFKSVCNELCYRLESIIIENASSQEYPDAYWVVKRSV